MQVRSRKKRSQSLRRLPSTTAASSPTSMESRASRRTTSSEGTRACFHPPCRKLVGPLLQVLSKMLVHLEHAHGVFAEHRPELVVSFDLALVLRILKVVLLDVVP